MRSNIKICVHRDEMISPLLLYTPPSIPLCLFDSLKCHLNTGLSLSLARSPSLRKSLCCFVHLLSPNMVNRTEPHRHSSRRRVCVAAERLINISLSLSLGHSVAEPVFADHLSPWDHNLKLECESRRGRSFLMVLLYTNNF